MCLFPELFLQDEFLFLNRCFLVASIPEELSGVKMVILPLVSLPLLWPLNIIYRFIIHIYLFPSLISEFTRAICFFLLIYETQCRAHRMNLMTFER